MTISPYAPSMQEWMRQVSSALNLLLPVDQTNIYEWGGDRGALALRNDVAGSPAKAGWAALKVGVCAANEAGWLNNPTIPGAVAFYPYATSANGRTNVWASNPIVDVTAGNDATAWGVEINVNNACSVVTDPGAVLKKTGLDIVTGGPNNCTVAARVSAASTNSTGLWNTGYYAERCAAIGFWAGRPSGDTGTQFSTAGFRDNSNSAVGFLIDGGTHTYGIDLVGGTYFATAIRLPNNSALAARNAANSGDLALISLDTGNRILLGPSVSGYAVNLSALGNYASDAAASAGGVAVGGLYRNGSVVMVRTV